MAGAVAAQRLGETPQHQVAVGFEHHVDEIDDHDAADIAQTQLPHDLLGGFQVVAGDGFFQVAAGSGELPGVDVDNRHCLGAIDHEGSTRGQPHLAIQRLGQLLVDAVHREHVRTLATLVPLNPRKKIGGNRFHIVIDGVPRGVTLDDELGEVLVEQVTNHLDQHVGFFIQRHGSAGRFGGEVRGTLFDALPLLLQPLHIGANVLFPHTLRGGADDDTGVRRHDVPQDLLEALTFGIRQLAADTG
ncbi:Uncharacterised protein [Mycobacteroides abscessus subsp. massiliense]|nr:Uncharacterised protein [Mycobacteroides abscessus subsp. massiliense]